MVTMSGAPWSVTLDYSHDAAFALVVRDALGITDPLGLAAVHPPQALTVDPAVRASSGIDQLWQHWWNRVTSPARREETGLPALPDGPLGRVVEENFTVLHQWSAARKREVAHASKPTGATPRVRDVLREYERTTGIRLGGFQLRVTALPVAGSVFLPLDDDRVLVSIALLIDRAEYLQQVLAHVSRA
ncbi:hypothetical protein [Kitasatospora sp. NPDC056531]|uniref:hypothetical protein n=1 Tax=Kitasatospora sp. NPDC056531 TaxID=3345856 RepID=UPI0036CE21A9